MSWSQFFMNLPEDQATWLMQVAGGVIVLLGAIIGSFLNVCIYRIPLEQSIAFPGSHCFSCGKAIPWYHNIPILSWLVLRGKCANCKAEISARYLIVEALTALLFLMAFIQWGAAFLLHMTPISNPALIPVHWLFICSLIVGTFIDFDHWIIPDRVTLGGMLAGLLFSALLPEMQGEMIWWKGLLWSAVGLVTGFGILFLIAVIGEKIFKKEAMGMGDVKWLGAFGAFFGWKAVIFILIFACVAGSIAGLAMLASRKADLRDGLPFGPYLALGALIWLFWGKMLWRFYLAYLSGQQPGEGTNTITLALLAFCLLALAALIWRRIRLRNEPEEWETVEEEKNDE